MNGQSCNIDNVSAEMHHGPGEGGGGKKAGIKYKPWGQIEDRDPCKKWLPYVYVSIAWLGVCSYIVYGCVEVARSPDSIVVRDKRSDYKKNGTEESDEEDEHAHEAPYMIAFLFMSFLTGAIIRTLLKLTHLSIPYTVILLVTGALFGLISSRSEELKSYTVLGRVNPHIILHAFLPVLIFESAFSMDAHTFLRSFMQVVIVAVPGLLLASLFTAFVTMHVFSYKWDFLTAMLFGSIVSATDPVAVVALLKDLGVSEQLSMLIEGESLLNDGAAIVVYKIFYNLKVGKLKIDWSLLRISAQIVIGGPLFGLLMGKASTIFLARIFNDATTEITITLVSAYFTFYVGEEVLNVSGVLAVVVLGVVVSAERTSISPEVENLLHHFWEMLAYLCNTVIFLLVGIVITESAASNIREQDWFYILVLYISCNIIRFVMLLMLSPILTRIGYGLPWQNAVVVVWGGLRGAVGLALALLVSQDEQLGKDENIGPKILLHTAGLVTMTLLLNATTMNSLLDILGMSDISMGRRLDMSNAVRHLLDTKARATSMLKMDRFLADARWSFVDKATLIEDPYNDSDGILDQDEDYYLSVRCTKCPNCNATIAYEPSPKEQKDIVNEACLRILKAVKISYWRQYEHGMLSEQAVRILTTAASLAEDQEGILMDVQSLKKQWDVRGIIPLARRYLERAVRRDASPPEFVPPTDPCGHTTTCTCIEVCPCESSRNITGTMRSMFWSWRMCAYRLVIRPWFEFFIYLVILANLIYAISILMLEPDYGTTMGILIDLGHSLFMTIYVVEVIVKVMAFGFRQYISSHWNKLDLIVTFLAVVDLVMELLEAAETRNAPAAKLIKVMTLFRMLRIVRALRLIRPTLPKVVTFLNARVNDRLFLGYDVGKGFIVGHEEVIKYLPHMVDNKLTREKMKVRMDHQRLDVIKSMGLLQRQHPGIAIAVKTRQSTRAVINNMRQTLIEMRGGGLIGEKEFHKLLSILEAKIKKLSSMPSSIMPPPAETMLRQISWLSGDEDMADFIVEKAELMQFDYGNMIVHANTRSTGILLIVSGMVRVAYTPSNDTIQDLITKGALPNADIITGNLDEEQEDFLSSGSLLGELALLSDALCANTVTCETAVQAYYVPLLHMRGGFTKFSDTAQGLRTRIWKSVALRVAAVILTNVPAYQSWPQDKIKMHLERSFLMNIDPGQALQVTDMLEDLMLINGRLMNSHTREIYCAPMYIPRTVQKLTLPPAGEDSERPVPMKLLVVPAPDVDIGYDGTVIQVEAKLSTCLLHSHSNRMSRMTVKSKAKMSKSKKHSIGKFFSGRFSDVSEKWSRELAATSNQRTTREEDVEVEVPSDLKKG